MSKWLCLAMVVCLRLNGTALAHLCNNIYRTPDRLVVKPERDDLSVEKSETFRVFVKNNFPTFLDNVRLSVNVDDPACQVTITPQSIPHMKAAEKAVFSVRVEVGPNAKAGRKALQVGVSADQVGFRPAAEVTNAELQQVMKQGDKPVIWGNDILAAESLARCGDPSGVEWLRATMDHRVRGMAVRAIRAAGMSGNKDLTAALMAKLQSRDGLLKGTAVLALGLLGAEAETVAAFVGDADEFVRTCAQTALAIQGDQAQLGALRTALTSTNPWARAAAAWALGYYGDKSAVDLLDNLFDAARDAELKLMVGDALISIADKHADLRTMNQPAASAPRPKSTRVASAAAVIPQQPLADKLTIAACCLCGMIGLGLSAYEAHRRWGVRRRR